MEQNKQPCSDQLLADPDVHASNSDHVLSAGGNGSSRAGDVYL